jgi:hypothetical protein
MALVAFAALPNGNIAQAAPITIDVPMLGANENPPVNSPGSGFARFTFDETTKVLTYAVTISGIPAGEVTAAHIHRGAVGVNGPIVYNLSTVGFTQVSGQITLTDADVADLKAGNFYVNAHSLTNPAGFARGQINLTPDAAIKASVDATAAAYNRKDISAFLNGFTTAGALNEFEASTIDEVRANLADQIGEPPITKVVVSNVRSTGATTATATVDLTIGAVVERHLYSFLLVGGVWKIDGGTIVDAPIGAGTTVVPVSLKEFNFSFDKSATASGNIAFQGTNNGQQFHEMAIAKIPANANLQELLADEEAPGVEMVGVVFMAPGDSASMVFSQPLAAGRYAMVCFVPDEATGTPHAFLGMATDFTVGSAGGGAVRPPSTGDGGLIGGSHTGDALLAAGVLMLLAGGSFALTTIRVRSES